MEEHLIINTMKNIQMIKGLKELDVQEQSEITGGRTLWGYFCYYLGRAANYIEGDS
jgi:hypothetical protein